MKISYELSVEDMRKAVAKYLDADIQDVSIMVKTQRVGYGQAEHDEHIPYCVVKFDKGAL